mgnify:CR=1 FL=1
MVDKVFEYVSYLNKEYITLQEAYVFLKKQIE